MQSTAVVAWICCLLTISVGAGSQAPADKPPQASKAAEAANEHTMTGCLQKGAEPRTFVVQNTESKGPKVISIVDSKVDLQGYLGLKVAITGSALTEKEVAKMNPKPSKADHYMRVTAAKLVTTACP